MSYDYYGQAPAAYGHASAAADPYAYAAPGYGAPHAAPQPSYYAPPHGGHYQAPGYGQVEEIRTIFISGFPGDVKERELNNLLRFMPGYEASQMGWKNQMAQGFALFTSGGLARAANEAIQGLPFDETTSLRSEMARKNMYIREDPSLKRPRTFPPTSSPPGGGYVAPGSAGQPPFRASQYAPVSNTGDNPPCNTLFIGNLGDTTDEAELRAVFESQPGFQQLKLMHNGKSVSCFVEMADVASAMAVHQSQQGVMLSTSERGGIRIQFSRNPFGKKRDRDTGSMIDTPLRAPDSTNAYGMGPPGV